MSNELADLISGYASHKNVVWNGVPTHEPFAAVLTCSDARVTPSLVFGREQGDLFVVRNAGNSATAAALASLDFASEALGVPVVLVMGHTACGAVEGALDPESPPYLDPILDPLRATMAVTGAKAPEDLSFAHARRTAGLLRTHPGPVGQRIREGVVQLVPMVFDLKSGIVRDAASDARPEISV